MASVTSPASPMQSSPARSGPSAPERAARARPTDSARIRSSARSEVLSGARDTLPLIVGYAPFALVVGAAVGASAVPWAAWSGTLLIYAGTAHLTLLDMLGAGAAAWSAVAAGALINARLMVYSAATAPTWAGSAGWKRLLVAATAVEPTWAVFEQRRRRPGTTADHRAHYVGATVAMTVGWLASVSVGALVGANDRLSEHLFVAAPLCLVAIVIPHARERAGAVAVLSAVATTVLVRALVPGAELMAAMVAAACAGVLVDRWRAS